MDVVFKRTCMDSPGRLVPLRLYHSVFAAMVVWGVVGNILAMRWLPWDQLAEAKGISWLFVYGVCCLLGVMLFTGYSSVLLSFVGFSLVALPLGPMAHAFFCTSTPHMVPLCLKIILQVTVVLWLLGLVWPSLFWRVVGVAVLAAALAAVAEFVDASTGMQPYTHREWLLPVVICLVIGVDWGRTSCLPPTLDNAVDGAAALCLEPLVGLWKFGALCQRGQLSQLFHDKDD